MRLLFHYRDLLSSGGVPGEIEALLSAFHEAGASVECLARAGTAERPHVRSYRGPRDFLHQWRRGLRGEVDAAILLGYFDPTTILGAAAARRAGVPVVLVPLNQVNPAVFRTKLFPDDPDVRRLEREGSKKAGRLRELERRLNPTLKRAYRRSAGTVIAHLSELVWVLSDYEREQYLRFHPAPPRASAPCPGSPTQRPQSPIQDIFSAKSSRSMTVAPTSSTGVGSTFG